MADDAGDAGKAAAQPALDGIDESMHRADRQRRIDAAMEIHDLAVGGLAHAHVVHLAEAGQDGGQRRERLAALGDARGGGVAAGQERCRQRLDMGFDLDVRSQLLADRLFEPARGLVRGGQRQRAVHLQIRRYR